MSLITLYFGSVVCCVAVWFAVTILLFERRPDLMN